MLHEAGVSTGFKNDYRHGAVVGVVIKEDVCGWNGEGQEDLEVKRGYYNRVPVNFPTRFSLFRFSPIHQLLNC